jgi:hypothetical protein
MLARRHLEVCVFSHLAAELRSGDIAVAGSDSYANLHSQMMTWEECRGEVADFCAQAGIPTDAKALVAFYRKKLTKMAATVDAGYPANRSPCRGWRRRSWRSRPWCCAAAAGE